MRKTFLTILTAGQIIFSSCNQKENQNQTMDQQTAKGVEQDSAGKTIDQFKEMKTYFIVFLRPGAKMNSDTATVQHILKEHLRYSTKMYNEGQAHVLGPVLDESSVCGIVIYGTSTIQEAKAFAEQDPAVKEGVFIADVHPWYSFKGAVLK
jgi:uncharacterized protein YciI